MPTIQEFAPNSINTSAFAVTDPAYWASCGAETYLGDLSTTEDGGLAELPDSQPRSARQTVMRMIRQGCFQSAQISKASLCRQPVWSKPRNGIVPLSSPSCNFTPAGVRSSRNSTTPLQERQIQMLASILKRYFKALSKDLPIDAKDLAGSLIALAQGLSLQRPLPKPGKPGSAARVINAMLKLFTA